MAGLVPAIHVFCVLKTVREDVDARHKAGHDGGEVVARNKAGHDWREAVSLRSSWPGSSRPSTSLLLQAAKTWMPGIKPGMTVERQKVVDAAIVRNPR
jgi:hypothetical protein